MEAGFSPSGAFSQDHLRHLSELYDYVAMVGNPDTFSIPSSVQVKVPFKTVIYDPNNMWDVNLRSFIIPFTGLWIVGGSLRVEPTGGSYRYIGEVVVDGVPGNGLYGRRVYDMIAGGGYQVGGGNQTNATGVRGVTIMYLKEGQQVDLYHWHSIPTTRTYPVSLDPRDNHFSLTALRKVELGEFEQFF